jgi:hypothetical protein
VPLNIEHEIFAQMHALLTLKLFIAIATIKIQTRTRLRLRSAEKKAAEKFKFLASRSMSYEKCCWIAFD